MLKCFSGTTIFTFLNSLSLPSAVVDFPKIIDLYFEDDELFIATLVELPAFFVLGSLLSNYDKLPDASE